MTWALEKIDAMTAEEIGRKPRLCISDSEFDEIESILGIQGEVVGSDGDRAINHKGAIIYTSHANWARGIA